MKVTNRDLITINGTTEIYEVVRLVEGGCIVTKDRRRTEFFVAEEHIDEIVTRYARRGDVKCF